jgi:hypothetical protein
MCFTAESEKDLQEWLVPLKAVAGVESFRTTAPITYVHAELLTLWAKSTTKTSETVLHLLARFRAQNTSEGSVVKLSAWFIANGVDVNAINTSKQTALHLALKFNGNKEFVNCLLLRGADVTTLRDSDGQTVSELLLQLTRGSVRASISPSSAPSTVDPGVYELVMARSPSVSNPILNNRSSVNLSPAPPAASPSTSRKSTKDSPGKALSDSSSAKTVTLGPMKLKGYSYARLYLKDRCVALF